MFSVAEQRQEAGEVIIDRRKLSSFFIRKDKVLTLGVNQGFPAF